MDILIYIKDTKHACMHDNNTHQLHSLLLEEQEREWSFISVIIGSFKKKSSFKTKSQHMFNLCDRDISMC